MERFDVVVVGSLNLDLVARAPRLPGPGETVAGHAFTEVPGGKGLNQAVAAARAGARVAMVGAVGDDAAGAVLRAVVSDAGVDDRLIATMPGTPTGRALIAVDGAGENSIVVVPGANAAVELNELPSAAVVLAQLEVDPGVVAVAFRAARAAGATTILNPAPAERVPPDLLTLCDLVVPNEHELAVLGGRGALAEAGVGRVVVTRGADGADLFDAADPGSAATHVDAFAVTPVDTTGAGDAFCGGLAARLAAGDPLPQALAYAAANGALATTGAGAVPSLPTAAETRSLLDVGPPGAVPSDEPSDEPSDVAPDVPPATPPVAPPGTSPGAPLDASPGAVARRYVEAFAAGDPDRIAALVTDDFVNDHASALGSGCVGRDEYRSRLPGFLASLPGLRYDIDQVVGSGETVAVAYRLTATSGGHAVDVRGVMLIEVRGGSVARRTDYWDSLTFLRQTGQA